MFPSIKMEKYAKSELSGIFWVKVVDKHIVLGSLGTHFMHIRVNAFSYLGLDFKSQKCVFEVWWRRKPSFSIVSSSHCYQFWLEMVVPQENLSFTNVSITLLWAQSKKTSFWGYDDVIMMPQGPRPKLRLGTGMFLLSDTDNNKQWNLSQKKTPKDLK